MTTKKTSINFKDKGLMAMLAAGASVLSLSVAAPAMSQEVDEIADLEEDNVVVTGSRISRRGFEDLSQPALVLQAETFDKRGFTNVATALNELPAFGGGIDGITTGSGQNVGQNFLDLFDLGTQRTLVVVNGRRFVPGNPLSADPIGRVEGSQVDINNFAPALIERVEVLSVGGAPIYGADAIAGTINLILKDDYEGVDLSFQYSDFVEFGAPTYTVNGLFGTNFSDGRGNVTASIQYDNSSGTVGAGVPTFDDQISGFADGANPIILNEEGRFNILEGPRGFLPAPDGGVPLPGLGGIRTFQDPDGNILTFAGDGGLSFFDPGVATGSSAFFFSGGSGFDLQDFNELLVPVERFVFGSTAKYDVNDYVTVFMENNFLNSTGTDLVSQSGTAFNTAFLGGQGQGAFAVDINNPFISEADRQTLITAGAGDTFFLNGINLGLLPNSGANFVETTTFRTVGGIKGDFELGERKLAWEVSMNFGRTSQTRNQAEISGGAFFNAVNSEVLTADRIADLQDPENLALLEAQTDSTLFNVIRGGELLSIGADQAQVGDITCSINVDATGAVDADGTLGIVDPTDTPTRNGFAAGCVPLNLFIGQLPVNAGTAQAAAIDFISGNALSSGNINQTDFLAFIGGDLIELPAGWAQFNAGYERRREFGSLASSGFSEGGFSREPAIASFPGGQITSNEIFGELVLPVLSSDFNLGLNNLVGFNLLSSLELNGAYRHISADGETESAVSLTGNALGDSVDTYTLGGVLRLLDDDLTLRGNYTRSVRQPSIVELFAPFAQAFDQTADPCDISNINDQGPNAARIQNCVTAAQQAGFSQAFFGEGLDLNGNVATGLILAPGDEVFTTPSVNAAVPLLTGGNAGLNFEIGDSFTAGFIYQPSFIPGLTFGADYISISVSDAIAEPDFSFFTQTCFDDGLDSPECDNFNRDGVIPATDGTVISGFDITDGFSGFANSDTFDFRAIQGQFRYNFEVADAFNFASKAGLFGQSERDLGSARINATFFAPLSIRDSTLAIADQPDGSVTNIVGTTTGNSDELSIVADFSWDYKGFNLFWRSTYQDNVDPCQFRVENDCNDIPAFARPLQRDVEHNLSLGYEINDNIAIRGGINNVLNNEQTIEQQAFGGGNVFGRSFFLRFNLRG